jgi:hypothetical protein
VSSLCFSRENSPVGGEHRLQQKNWHTEKQRNRGKLHLCSSVSLCETKSFADSVLHYLALGALRFLPDEAAVRFGSGLAAAAFRGFAGVAESEAVATRFRGAAGAFVGLA